MVNYETAPVEDIAEHFSTISRQRIQQILGKFTIRGNDEVVEKIIEAKALLKKNKYVSRNGCTVDVKKKCWAIWNGINLRVGTLAYKDCTNEFDSLPAFRAWAVKQIGFNEPGFELDKDILYKGNRVYSPSTCVFVPVEVNGLFSGCYHARRRGKYPLGVSFNKGSGSFVAQMSDRQQLGLDKYLGSFKTVEEAFACYKAAKEARIKRIAEKWKDRIDPRAYAAMMARTVEWND